VGLKWYYYKNVTVFQILTYFQLKEVRGQRRPPETSFSQEVRASLRSRDQAPSCNSSIDYNQSSTQPFGKDAIQNCETIKFGDTISIWEVKILHHHHPVPGNSSIGVLLEITFWILWPFDFRYFYSHGSSKYHRHDIFCDLLLNMFLMWIQIW